MRRPLLLAAASAVLLSGCALLSQFLDLDGLTGAGPFTDPTLTFKSADVAGVSLTGLKLTTRWELNNPNPVGLDLASVDYALFIEDQPVLAGKPERGLKVPENGKVELTFPAEVQFASLVPLLQTFLLKDVARYQAKGTLGVQTPLGLMQLPLQYQGQFEVPKIPQVQLLNPRITGLTFTGASIDFPLSVTNRNTFPLPIKGVIGAVSIAGARIGTLSTGDLGALESKGTRSVTLPLRVDFLQVGAAVASLIQGGAANVTFDAQVDSSGATFPLKLDQALNFVRAY